MMMIVTMMMNRLVGSIQKSVFGVLVGSGKLL